MTRPLSRLIAVNRIVFRLRSVPAPPSSASISAAMPPSVKEALTPRPIISIAAKPSTPKTAIGTCHLPYVPSSTTPASEKPYSRRTSGATSGKSCRSIALITYEPSRTPKTTIRRTPRSVRGAAEIPIEDLLSRPEDDAGTRLNVLKCLAEIAEPMPGAHDVGVDDERHHARGRLRVCMELFELIDRAVAILGCLVMLNQHHRDVVALLRVGHADQ